MQQYKKALEAIANRMKSFLDEDMGIEVVDNEISIDNGDKFNLSKHTAIIGLGGEVKALTLYSFDESLANKLVESFTYGEITKEEKEELLAEIPAEVANTVIGNAIPNFPNAGKGATITPPIIIKDAQLAMKLKNSTVLTAMVETKYGNALCALLN